MPSEERLEANVPIGFKGLVEYGERRFVDRKPYVTPRHEDWRKTGDPFWRVAPDMAAASIEEAANTPSGVAKANVEPGPSEYSWGRGLMAPLALGPEPTAVEQMAAIRRTNPADPTANHNDRYSDWIRE